mmetsp:Transcript_90884/g.261881  ORF Transcript_90884/g.261881 Transcript_90884/m.261881 type:complete len:169 (+) Transcript_90884:101-607(+)
MFDFDELEEVAPTQPPAKTPAKQGAQSNKIARIKEPDAVLARELPPPIVPGAPDISELLENGTALDSNESVSTTVSTAASPIEAASSALATKDAEGHQKRAQLSGSDKPKVAGTASRKTPGEAKAVLSEDEKENRSCFLGGGGCLISRMLFGEIEAQESAKPAPRQRH